MANTVIQIKRSTVTTAPTAGSLSAAEPAYSYLSDKLFIGSSDGSQVIEIGGRYYVNTAIQAYNQANSAQSIAIAAFEKANTGDADLIAAAFNKANAANLLAYNTGIGANAYAVEVGTAGNAYALSTATAIGTAGNNYTNAVGAAGNAYALSTATAIGTAGNAYALSTATAIGTAGNNYTNAVGAAGNTYTAATYLPLAGGTITGSLVVQQNLTISGTVTYANTQTLLIGDNILTLNADLPIDVAPSENAGMEINRGSSSNVSLLWNEGIDKWQFTNDGTNYYNIASNADVTGSETIAIAAFDKANAANLLAYNTGIGANAYATSVGTAGNNYTDAVGAAGNAYTVAVGTAGNAYASAVGTAANSYAAVAFNKANGAVQTGFVTVSAGGTSLVAASNNDTLTITSANGVTIVGDAGADSIVLGLSPTGVTATSYGGSATVGTFAVNEWGRITSAGNTAIAIDTSAITSGILTVPRGGTGLSTFTTNGILFGNTTGSLKVTAAGTDGQVLQASATGVPSFGMLDGGTF